ncbi:MAG: phage Vi, partial [Bacteroidota bacterium]
MGKGIRLTTKDFIEKSKNIHGEKYDYSLVNYINSVTKIEIICSEHGIFFQSPNKHLAKRGCPICGGKKEIHNVDIIDRFKKSHGGKYDYSLVEYKTSHDKVKIICKHHGVFEQRVDHHEGGQGCEECRIDNLKITKEKFIEKLELKFPSHFSNNIEYNDYSNEIEFYCLKTDSIYITTPKNILKIKKCPLCYE